MATNTDSVLIFGDTAANVYFVDAGDGTVRATQMLLYGNLRSAATLWNGIAFCPTSNPGSTGSISAFDAQSGVALWNAPIELDSATDAGVVFSGACMYVATGSGNVLSFDMAVPASPRTLWIFDAMQLGAGSATISGLHLVLGGAMLVLVTNQGVYAVNVATGVPSLAWSSCTGTDFSAGAGLQTDSMLYASAATALYAWDLNGWPAAPGGNLAVRWQATVPSGKTLGPPFWMGLNILFIGDSTGHFYLADSTSGAWCGPLSMSTGASGTLVTLHGNTLLVATTSGTLAAYRFDPTDLGLDATLLWTVNCAASIASAPYVIDQPGPGQPGATAFQPLVNGDVVAYDVTSGAALWRSNLGVATPGGCGQAGCSVPTQSSASINFLMDGQHYFLAVRDSLIAAVNGSFATPAQLPPDLTFNGLIKAVGSAGNSAFVLLWDAGNMARYLAALAEKTKMGAPLNLYANKVTIANLQGAPNVTASLAPYVNAVAFWDEPFATGASNHQKILVVSVAGTRLAFVGGLNLVTPEYWDTTSHPMQGDDLHCWHDTAVVLQGTAADLVEREFDRRWARVKGAAPQPLGTTYVKASYWEGVGASCMDEYHVCNNGATPTPYASPRPVTPAVEMAVLTTDAEGTVPVQEIRQALVVAIANATTYVYFENCAFYDGALVRALLQRMNSTAGQSVLVIINIPLPQSTNDAIQSSYYALSRTALLTLMLGLGTWTSLETQSGLTIQRAGLWSAWVSFSDNAIENAMFNYQPGATGMTLRIPVNLIATLTTTDARVVVCGPARYFVTPPATANKQVPPWPSNFRGIYIHSKLALVDDNIAFVGTANFTERSMRQDGEIAVAIQDSATASTIRQSVFSHWGQISAATWTASMTAFQGARSDAVGILPITIDRLPGNAALPWSAWLMMAIAET